MPATAAAPATKLVSVRAPGGLSDGDGQRADVSADGRFVVFDSFASLVPRGSNGEGDVYLRDRVAGTTRRVSVTATGGQADEQVFGLALSPDGRFVTFSSAGTNLVPGDTNNATDVFLCDRGNRQTELVSVSSTEAQPSTSSGGGAISGDGRRIAFFSSSRDLVPGDTNRVEDVFLRDRVSGNTVLASVDSRGEQGTADSFVPATRLTVST